MYNAFITYMVKLWRWGDICEKRNISKTLKPQIAMMIILSGQAAPQNLHHNDWRFSVSWQAMLWIDHIEILGTITNTIQPTIFSRPFGGRAQHIWRTIGSLQGSAWLGNSVWWLFWRRRGSGGMSYDGFQWGRDAAHWISGRNRHYRPG